MLPARLELRPASELHLVEPRPAGREASPAAWSLLFGALCLPAGHGLFLLAALTRLEKVPSLREVGSPFQLAVVAWFVATPLLALLAALFRARLARLASRRLWALALGCTGLTLVAFTLYLRAVALAI